MKDWALIWTPEKKKPCKLLSYKAFWLSFVVPPGIEPGTQGFSVLCSTN